MEATVETWSKTSQVSCGWNLVIRGWPSKGGFARYRPRTPPGRSRKPGLAAGGGRASASNKAHQ